MDNAAALFIDGPVHEGHGDRAALVTPSGPVTYASLQRLTDRAAHGLRALGVEPEQRVAIRLPDGPAWAATFFGAIKLGAVAVPINTRLAPAALGTVLARMAETMERTKELRESVRSALIYPTILVFVAVASVMVLLVFVVPQFQTTFAQAGKALPIPTQIVIVAGTFLRNWWWALIPAAVLAVIWFRRRGRTPAVRRLRDTRMLRMPSSSVIAK